MEFSIDSNKSRSIHIHVHVHVYTRCVHVYMYVIVAMNCCVTTTKTRAVSHVTAWYYETAPQSSVMLTKSYGYMYSTCTVHVQYMYNDTCMAFKFYITLCMFRGGLIQYTSIYFTHSYRCLQCLCIQSRGGYLVSVVCVLSKWLAN